MVWKSLMTCFVGSLVRMVLFYTGFSPVFQKRVEVSTPLNSWINVQEGLYLKKKGINPYDGDSFHETPFMLAAAETLSELPVLVLYVVFILCDLFTAINLAEFVNEAKNFYLCRSQEESPHVNESKELKLLKEDNYGDYVLMCYLFSPFTIMSCVALTTAVFGNLALSFAMLAMIKGCRLTSCMSLAVATSQSLYPVALILPLVICVYNKEFDKAKSRNRKQPEFIMSVLKSVVIFVVCLGVLVYASAALSNGFVFLDRIYGFILSVPDLKPNIGLFWYFFTEMFEHFHLLFICTFQINAFIYFIPLTLRFEKEPALLIYTFCAIVTIFKSYPSAADLGLYMALIPMWKHLAPFMQQKFIVACFFIATTVLAPVQWYLWIYSGSANANFYFGVTIALGTAQIFLLTDVLLSYLKREYYLKNGMSKEIDGKAAVLALH